jgi:hypothetical protein
MKIIVIGAGAWGTALAVSAAPGPCGDAVGARCGAGRMPCRRRAKTRATCRVCICPMGVGAYPVPVGLWPLVPRHDLAIIATPVAGLRPMLQALAPARACGLAVQGVRACPGGAAWPDAPRGPPAGGASIAWRRPERAQLCAGGGCAASPRHWSPPATSRRSVKCWSRPSTAPRCGSMPTTIWSALKSGAPSRTCWPLPPACVTGSRWA